MLYRAANEVKIVLVESPDCVVVGYCDPLANRMP
jgi:hypothetical protein